jgi:hypothetical protein
MSKKKITDERFTACHALIVHVPNAIINQVDSVKSARVTTDDLFFARVERHALNINFDAVDAYAAAVEEIAEAAERGDFLDPAVPGRDDKNVVPIPGSAKYGNNRWLVTDLREQLAAYLAMVAPYRAIAAKAREKGLTP